MKTVKTFARQFSFGLMMAVTLGSAVVSCDSILDEDDVDCSVEYRVKFKYDYNMKYADAFSREVSSVALYAFDDNGKLVYQKTEAGDVLAADGYSMAVDMEPGDYHLITWAGLSDEASFSVPLITQGVSSLEELQCKMDRIYSRAADRSAVVLSLKMAEAAAAAQITGEHPVLLLDDVLSELDEGRKQYLLTCMKEKQTFVTSCDDTDFLKTDGEVYRMDGGVLSRVRQHG